jgi:hypothetical protein
MSMEGRDEILNLKQMDFKVYSDVIDEKEGNQIFNSVLSNYGTLELDEHIDNLPNRYEIRERKRLASMRI